MRQTVLHMCSSVEDDMSDVLSNTVYEDTDIILYSLGGWHENWAAAYFAGNSAAWRGHPCAAGFLDALLDQERSTQVIRCEGKVIM